MPSDRIIAYPPGRRCSGFCCNVSGQDGKLRLSWSPHKPWCSGIAPVSASTGSGSPEPGRSVDASPSAKSFGRSSSVAENPTWGAPRIHGELLKLGFQVSEPTVSRWLRRAPRSPDIGHRWLSFFPNHREAIAALGFFTVPPLPFGGLYCFFVIGPDRPRIL